MTELVAELRTLAAVRLLGRRLDAGAARTWALSLAVILYLAFHSGGYALQAHAQVAIAVWWIVTICAAWRLLPLARLSASALVITGAFAAFTAWTALGITWSISSGRSFEDLALISCYLGVLVLGVAIHRERDQALRHTLAAVASAIVLVAAAAVASRLFPHLFSGSLTASQTPGNAAATNPRLSWPLNYWNALAALMALGIPLLLALASSARSLWSRAAACAGVPLLALCLALTQSRGGVISAAVGVLAFIALSPGRVERISNCAVAAAGSVALVAGGLERVPIRQAYIGASEHRAAGLMLIAILITCAGTGLAQAGGGLLFRHASLPRLLTPARGRARVLLACGAVIVIAVALAAHVPHRLDHAWQGFKNPVAQGGGQTHFGVTSGEGRYQYWVAAVDSAESHPLTGSGPGTFQLDWLPRAPIVSYVQNAHSLYVETYAELGVVGLVLLVSFLVGALVVALRAMLRAPEARRTQAAGVFAALLSFIVGAALDWLWQMPVIGVAVMLLIAATLAPAERPQHLRRRAGAVAVAVARVRERRPRPRVGLQVALTLIGLASLVAVAYPLTVSNAISASQRAAGSGDGPLALSQARNATSLEPGSAAAQLQLALVLESQRRYGAAVSAARHAVADEPQGWTGWLELSRLYAEDGNAPAALHAYRRARAMNPTSGVFANVGS